MQSPSVSNALWLYDRQKKKGFPCKTQILAEAGINLFYMHWTEHYLV